MDKDKLKKVKALMQLGMSFNEACVCLGYNPQDPDLQEIPDILKNIFDKF